jgi:hypothetical protein
MSRFAYIKYDAEHAGQQSAFKRIFEGVEAAVNELANGRAKALVLTKLEEAYMWIGKAIRDDQIAHNQSTEEQPERNNE